MAWEPQTFRYTVAMNDVVELVTTTGPGSTTISDIVEFLKGGAATFREYLVPYYPDHPRMRQIGERHWTMIGASGGPDEYRLRALAGLNRSFDWSHDPRLPGWRERMTEWNQGVGDEPIDDLSTQELWDILLACVRADRFNEGTIEVNAVALTRIANEIRRRLLAGRATSP
jgi:hypothetical protein